MANRKLDMVCNDKLLSKVIAMNILQITTLYNSQKECIKYLEKLRWPQGPECAYCKSKSQSKKTKEERYTCLSCNSSYSVTVGTIFASSKVPLPKWFAAIGLILDAKKGISSLQLSRHLEVNKNTAWYMQYRIRKAMKEQLTLMGTVEIDETFVGGSVSNMHNSHVEKHNIHRGGMEHKTPVLGMIERDGKVVLKVIPKANKEIIRPILNERITGSRVVITDGFGPYRTLGKEFKKHIAINHEKKEKAKGKYNLSSIEGFWTMLKRAIMGVYHSVTSKHLQAYVDELAFKHNYRFNKNTFKILISKLLNTSIAIN